MQHFKSLVMTIVVSLMGLFTPISTAVELQEYIDSKCSMQCVGARTLMQAVYSASYSLHIDPLAMLAIVQVESRFRVFAKNRSSVGLTQILFRVHRSKFTGTNPYDVKDNIFAGSIVLSECVRKHHGNYKQAYRCYNGYGAYSHKYVNKVLSAYNELKSIELNTEQSDLLREDISLDETSIDS